ncbi:MAG: hypothetical protein ACRDZQ_12955 [Acidimicrobiales bacterium]
MAETTTTTRSDDHGIPELGSELWELVLAYLKQETLQPIKGLGRYVAFGVAGSVVGAIGLVLLDLAGLRAMQEETGTTFQGAHSWMPYAVCAVGTLVIVALAGLRVVRGGGRSG